MQRARHQAIELMFIDDSLRDKDPVQGPMRKESQVLNSA